MTEKLYYQDAYETAFRAKVLDCQKEKEHFLVTLDRTYFYPEGGGQPADHGTLGGAAVLEVSNCLWQFLKGMNPCYPLYKRIRHVKK